MSDTPASVKTDFAAKMQEGRCIVEKLDEIAASPPELQHRLLELMKLIENLELRVCVVGEESAGKSTLLNLLLESFLLPSAFGPMTGCRTELIHDPQCSKPLLFRDDSDEPLAEGVKAVRDRLTSEFGAMQGKGESPATQQVLFRIRLRIPIFDNSNDEESPLPVVLEDSPGNSGLQDHTVEAATKSALRGSALIVILNGSTSPSRSLHEFWEHMLRTNPHLRKSGLWIVNKIDSLEPEDREPAVENYRTFLTNLGVEEPQVLPLSALMYHYATKVDRSKHERRRLEAFISEPDESEDLDAQCIEESNFNTVKSVIQHHCATALVPEIGRVLGDMAQIVEESLALVRQEQQTLIDRKNSLPSAQDMQQQTMQTQHIVENFQGALGNMYGTLENQLQKQYGCVPTGFFDTSKEWKDPNPPLSVCHQTLVSATIHSLKEPFESLQEKLKQLAELYPDVCSDLPGLLPPPDETYLSNLTMPSESFHNRERDAWHPDQWKKILGVKVFWTERSWNTEAIFRDCVHRLLTRVREYMDARVRDICMQGLVNLGARESLTGQANPLAALTVKLSERNEREAAEAAQQGTSLERTISELQAKIQAAQMYCDVRDENLELGRLDLLGENDRKCLFS